MYHFFVTPAQIMDGYEKLNTDIKAGRILSAYAVEGHGLAEAVSKMAFGNKLGVKIEHNLDPRDFFAPGFGDIILEVPDGKVGELSITYTVIGEVTADKVRIVQDADYIYREEIAKAGLAKNLGQYFAALTNMRSVGVMGDERTYDYAIALRAVNTSDFMTADCSEIPFEVLQKVMTRIINEVKGVNRVMYDLTSKPPGTIEFE